MNILTTTSAPIIWLILIVVLIVAEVATYQLVAVWFALGAVASLLASLMGASGTVQLITFVVVSLLSLIASRPLVKRKFNRLPRKRPTQTASSVRPLWSSIRFLLNREEGWRSKGRTGRQRQSTRKKALQPVKRSKLFALKA